MSMKIENVNSADENQLHDNDTLQDLAIQTLAESETDQAEEIKGGPQAILHCRKAGGNGE